MNEVHKTTLKDRLANAFAAFKGQPLKSMTYGVELKRCDKCDRVDGEKLAQLIENEIDHSHKNPSIGEAEYRAGLWRALELMEEARRL